MPDDTITQDDPSKNEIEWLRESAENSSSLMAGQLIVFLLAIMYILVTVYSTTDRDLLIANSRVVLPILGVNIPSNGFYVFAPLIVLAFHLNFLYSLSVHCLRLKRLEEECIKQNVPFKLKTVFLFNQILRHKDNDKTHKYFFSWLFSFFRRLFSSFIPYILPLYSLLYIQLIYSKYHNLPDTTYHFLCIVADIGILIYFGYNLVHQESKERLSKSSVKQYLERQWIGMIFCMAFGIAALANLGMVSFLITPWESPSRFVAKNLVGLPVLNTILVPRIDLPDQKHALVQSPPSDELLSAYLQIETKIQDRNTGNKDIEELDPRETAKNKAWLDHTRGLDLKGRNLQFANFYKDNLVHVDFKNAKLEDANLDSTWLIGADFQNADLKFSSFKDATLHRVPFPNANLTGANFTRTKLIGAILEGVEFKGSDLAFADLRGAILRNAKLQGAILWNVNLQFADLESADLRGAQLGNANLRFSNLRKAKLQGADLEGADLLGADLSDAILEGAYLKDANLLMVDFGEAPDKVLYGAYGELKTVLFCEKDKTDLINAFSLYEQQIQLFTIPENLREADRQLENKKDEISEIISRAPQGNCAAGSPSEPDPKDKKTEIIPLEENHLNSNLHLEFFVEARKKMACLDDHLYVAKSILKRQDILSDAMQEFLRKEIREYMHSNCPAKLIDIEE